MYSKFNFGGRQVHITCLTPNRNIDGDGGSKNMSPKIHTLHTLNTSTHNFRVGSNNKNIILKLKIKTNN